MPIDFVQIAEQNPWWTEPSAIHRDLYIRDFEAAPLRWVPPIVVSLSFQEDAVYTLRGPRQVGKTTALKLLIRRLMEEEQWQSPRICYFSCDLISEEQELVETLQLFLGWSRSRAEGRLAILLDEATSVPRWSQGLKYLLDLGKLRGSTIVVTGSHSLDVRRGGERLPGRRGDVEELDRLLLPLDFRTYWGCRRGGMSTTEGEVLASEDALWDLIQTGGQSILPLAAGIYEAEAVLRDYLLTGGFPRSSVAFHGERTVPNAVYQIYRDAVLGDVQRAGKSEDYLRQLCVRLLETQSSTISWNALAQQTDIGSHNTVREYVETLEGIFVLRTLRRFDLSKERPFYSKNKKIYFTDPFLVHTLSAWLQGSQKPFEEAQKRLGQTEWLGKLVEGVVAEHLARFFPGRVYYWRTREGREIDFLLDLGQQPLPIEVRYQAQIRGEDLKEMRRFRSGLLLSRKDMKVQDGILILPVSLFLRLVETSPQNSEV